jgi:hypothetical protein
MNREGRYSAQCPLLALSGQTLATASRPLSGVERTSFTKKADNCNRLQFAYLDSITCAAKHYEVREAIDDIAHCTFPTSLKNKLFAVLTIAH